MRRVFLAVAVVAGLLAGLPAVSAAQVLSRTVKTGYTGPGGLTGGTSTATELTSPGAWLRAGRTEDHVQVGAADSTGRPVVLDLEYQPPDQPGTVAVLVCGHSPFLPLTPGSLLRVTPVAGRCSDGSASAPTTGTVTLDFTRPVAPSTVVPPSRRWAVIVGITHYQGDTHPTYGGDGDAAAVRSALLKAGWRDDHLLVLTDGQATASAIASAISWLVQHSSPATFSLFHFSGHVCISSRGPCPSGHTYLWSVDNQFLAEDAVGPALAQVQGPAWFDFAGCESGAFDFGLHTGQHLVTGSSQASETSYEEPDWHESVWSGLVWDQAFLHGQDGVAAGRSTIAQMVGYGQSQAPRITANQPAGAQHPYVAGGNRAETLYAPRF